MYVGNAFVNIDNHTTLDKNGRPRWLGHNKTWRANQPTNTIQFLGS